MKFPEVLSFLEKPVVKQKANNNTLVFRFESEIPPVLSIKLKVETNCREHFNILGLVKQSFKVDSQWYTGACEITTYKLEELLGTKLRALYQRRKGRDLFDLYQAIKAKELNTEDIIKCYREYMNFVVTNPPSQKEFLLNMEAKVQDSEFLGDTRGLLRSNEVYEPLEAYELIKSELLFKI